MEAYGDPNRAPEFCLPSDLREKEGETEVSAKKSAWDTGVGRSCVWRSRPIANDDYGSLGAYRNNQDLREGKSRESGRIIQHDNTRNRSSSNPPFYQVAAYSTSHDENGEVCRHKEGKKITAKGETDYRTSATVANKTVSVECGTGGGDLSFRGGGVRKRNRRGTKNIPPKNPGTYTEDKEIVIRRLNQAAKRFWGHIASADREDRVHDTILEILERENNNEEAYPITWWVRWMYYKGYDKYIRKNKDEIGVEDIRVYSPVYYPTQLKEIEAKHAYNMLRLLPKEHELVMRLLVDGENPVSISENNKIKLADVTRIIRESRKWLDDGGIYLNKPTPPTPSPRPCDGADGIEDKR